MFHINTILAFTSVLGAARFDEPVFETAAPMVAAAGGEMEMKPSPIEPSWILEGNPEARIAEHSHSDDEAAVTAIWDCTAGRFKWYYGWDETVMILEGEVQVTDEAGVTRSFKAGDIVYFKAKTWATWQIDHHVRKLAFLRRPFPGPLQRAIRVYNKLKALRSGSAPLRSGL